MNDHDSCDWCLRQGQLYPIQHVDSGYLYHWCPSCVRQNVGNNPTAYSYNGVRYQDFRTRYDEIVADFQADRYLAANPTAMAAAMSMQEGPTAQEIHDRAADALELDAWYDMPSDAVLDKYIDANPDKFTYVVSGDNTADGLAEWAYLRSTGVEVFVA